jgi:hypothetical protein
MFQWPVWLVRVRFGDIGYPRGFVDVVFEFGRHVARDFDKNDDPGIFNQFVLGKEPSRNCLGKVLLHGIWYVMMISHVNCLKESIRFGGLSFARTCTKKA